MNIKYITAWVLLVVIVSCKEKTYQGNVIQSDLQGGLNEPIIIDSLRGEVVKEEKNIIDSKRFKKSSSMEDSVTITIDTTKYVVVDDFPVKDNMLGKNTNDINRKSGRLRSVDKVWFTNKANDQVLIFELYTDKYHVETFLFPGNNIHPAFLKRLALHAEGEALATLEEKIIGIKGFVDSSRKIDDKYFITNKSIRLGDTKEMIIQAYGKPSKTGIEDDVEVLQWKFTGELAYDGVSDLKGIPLAKNSFGHEAIAFVKNDSLIGLVFYNDIP